MARRRGKTRTIRISELSKVINEVLREYSEELVKAYNALAKTEAEQVVKDLQKNSPKKSGDYAKGWTYEKTGTDAFGVESYVVFNSDKPGLTHVLEYGHPVRNRADGPVLGRAEKHPHIGPAEKRMIRRMKKGVQELDPNNP